MLAYAYCLGSVGEKVQNPIALMNIDSKVLDFDGQAIRKRK